MTTKDDRKRKISKIQALPDQARKAVSGLTDAQLDTPYREGGWTVRQVIHHLADSHMNAFVRMKLILTEDNPTLKAYDQEQWAELHDGKGLPLESSLAILEGLHKRWVSLLERVPEDAWSRTAHHPEQGSITMDDLLNTYERHGENHVGQITGLRKSKGW